MEIILFFLLFCFPSLCIGVIIILIATYPSSQEKNTLLIKQNEIPQKPINEVVTTSISNKLTKPTNDLSNVKTQVLNVTSNDEYDNSLLLDSPYLYSLNSSLLNKNEFIFNVSLMNALRGTNYYICPKVRLIDIFKLVRYHSSYRTLKAKLIQKHIDFVIVDSRTFKIVAGIELDGNSHKYQSTKLSDALKDQIFNRVGIPLLRFQIQPSYREEIIRSRLNPIINN